MGVIWVVSKYLFPYNIHFKALSIFWHNNSASMIYTVDSPEICKNMCKEVHGNIKWHHKNGHNGNVTAIK